QVGAQRREGEQGPGRGAVQLAGDEHEARGLRLPVAGRQLRAGSPGGGARLRQDPFPQARLGGLTATGRLTATGEADPTEEADRPSGARSGRELTWDTKCCGRSSTGYSRAACTRWWRAGWRRSSACPTHATSPRGPPSTR